MLGAGAWFPFAVPRLLAVAGTPGVPAPSLLGIGSGGAVVVAGAAATLRWWQRSEAL